MTQAWKAVSTPLMLALAVLACQLWSVSALAAPSAKIIRIDAQPVVDGNSLTMTMVVDLGEPRTPSAALAPCGPPSKKLEYLGCAADALEKPGASYAPIAWPPHDKVDAEPDTEAEKDSVALTVAVDGADMPAELISRSRWGALAKEEGKVGTAYLILIDASATMGARLENAKAVARALVQQRGKNDIFNVKHFNDATWFAGSGWTNDQGALAAAIDGVYKAEEAPGRSRPLFDLIKNSALEGFGELGNRAQKASTPMHHALVVLSDGWAGTDFGGSAPALAQELGRLFADGILDENNLTAPRMPVPVISVWFPAAGFEEAFENARQFMQNLAVHSVGGAFFIAPDRGAERGAAISKSIRQRFNAMHVLEWRVPCLEASTSQSVKLLFRDEKSPILGDGWRGVPMAVDPRSWTLAVDAEATQRKADREPLQPGGTATILGRFCWGNDYERAEIYLVPKNQTLPEAGASEADARRARDDLTAKGLRATPIRSGDNYVEIRLPENDDFVSDGSARIIVVDGKSKRSSPSEPTTVLTLKASGSSSGSLGWIVQLVFGLAVIGLLVANLLRTNTMMRRRMATLPPPVVAGSGASPDLGRSVSRPPPAPVVSPGLSASGIGGAAANLSAATAGATVMFSAVPAAGTVQRARLGGAMGVFPVVPGRELVIGRDRGDIALLDARVSPSHARVKIDGGQLLVWDEGSEHGTFVNGARIAQRAWTSVAHGSVLRFGTTELMAQLE
jgi:hypothetical protein